MKKILIVDDSVFCRTLLKDDLLRGASILEDKEITVYEADGTKSALEKMNTVNPDLVILDVVMKDNEQEGVEILKKIKDSNPHQNVVMLTSVGQTSVMKRCQDLGVKDYLIKPVDSLHLMTVTRKYLK